MSGGARPVGDRGLLLELAGNEEVHRVAAAARERFGGVLADVVAGHRTVLLAWPEPPVDRRVAEALLAGAPAGAAAAGDNAGELTVPVVYDGPDLEAVAAHCSLSTDEVVRRHAAAAYRVGFVGFAPGFGYLLGGDPALRVPRRDEPRERVPAGSVALAGEYSAVYPSDSPGGWQLIGRTELRMFEAQRRPPALLQPGTRVRFEPA
jgi:KipI family sensor histidine kinase inhibitor